MAASPPPAVKGGKPAKPATGGALRSPLTWIIILGVAVVGGGYLLYRQYSNSQAATAAAATTPPTPDTTDYSGEIATLQTEIADLQSSFAQDKDTTTGGGGGTGGGGTGGGGGGGTGGGTTKKPGMPTDVHGSAASATSIKLTWTKVTGATGYRAHATYQGKATPSVATSGTTATLTGLTPDHTYTCHVLALNSAGESSETNGPVVKTPLAARVVGRK